LADVGGAIHAFSGADLTYKTLENSRLSATRWDEYAGGEKAQYKTCTKRRKSNLV
jgi:hypothetical protein